jgi:hypothetical protein
MGKQAAFRKRNRQVPAAGPSEFGASDFESEIIQSIMRLLVFICANLFDESM